MPKPLAQLLAGAPPATPVAASLAQAMVSGLEYDSRRVEPGYLFFAFPGAKADGRAFARQALDRGAAAIVSELAPPSDFSGPWIQVPHGRRALASAAKVFYEAPDERIQLTGITGTNGKTTTSYLIDAIQREAGFTTALVGTIEYHLAGRVLKAVNTTPESLDLFRLLDELVAAGGSRATMEVSSHALALGRTWGVSYHTAVFTNLTRDHLDFHGSMEAYFDAKRTLFAEPRHVVLNYDDAWVRKIEPAAGQHAYWYGLEAGADYRATDIHYSFEGTRFRLNANGRTAEVTSALVGRHNVYNILAGICAGLANGVELDTVLRGVAACRSVPGRFERVDAGQPFLVIVDYAHTDDALKNLIAVARTLHPKRVITLFGCGGDRDRAKRPLMAMAAASASDLTVLTSDNPRSEDPLAIINDALVGLNRFDTPHIVEVDRATAIRRAIGEAKAGDIVLIAGKGHEPYQVLKDRTIDFDDRLVARAAIEALGARKVRAR